LPKISKRLSPNFQLKRVTKPSCYFRPILCQCQWSIAVTLISSRSPLPSRLS
jgi:hypothetical protein